MSEYIMERPDSPAKVVRDGWNVRIEWDFKQREEIVRCRDCVYFCNHKHANGTEWQTCSYFDSEHAEGEPDGFCAWGEKRSRNDEQTAELS